MIMAIIKHFKSGTVNTLQCREEGARAYFQHTQ